LVSEIDKTLKLNNLPKFTFDNSNCDSIKYFVMENDEDGNNDTSANIDSIKSGDYGFPINYNSKYLIGDYEYSDNLNQKQEIESIILESVNQNFSQLFNA